MKERTEKEKGEFDFLRKILEKFDSLEQVETAKDIINDRMREYQMLKMSGFDFLPFTGNSMTIDDRVEFLKQTISIIEERGKEIETQVRAC